jgi:peptidyl-prolyl cis-trans isomerase SurA
MTSRAIRVLSLIVLVGRASAARAEIVDRVIVKVNGDIVTLSDFEARQVQAVQANRIPVSGVEAYLRDNNAKILQDAIDDLLLVQKADELGVHLKPEYLQEVIDGIRKDNNIPSEDALREELHKEGLSIDDMRRNIGRSILRQQVLSREVQPKVIVSETAVKAYYDAHLAEYTKPAAVHLEEILIPATADDPKNQADDVVAKARAGADFEALAKELSSAPTAKNGGDLGTMGMGELHADVRAVAEGLKVGEISEPVATADGGYRVVRLVSRSDIEVTPYDTVKSDIHKKLGDAKWTEEYDKYVADLRTQAIIDVRVREVPLQVQLPSAASILEPPDELKSPTAPRGPSRQAPAAASDDEFSVSPQSAPERVTPGGSADDQPPPKDKKPEDAPPPQ